jgi:hypothetical protein
MDFAKFEQDAKAAVEKLVREAETHEKGIDDAAIEALTAAGAPSVVATAVGGLLSVLLDHFKSVPGSSENVLATPTDGTGTPANPPAAPDEVAKAPMDTSAWAPPVAT